jgi:hypothetical protein
MCLLVVKAPLSFCPREMIPATNSFKLVFPSDIAEHAIDFQKMILARPEGGIRGGVLQVRRTRNSEIMQSKIFL